MMLFDKSKMMYYWQIPDTVHWSKILEDMQTASVADGATKEFKNSINRAMKYITRLDKIPEFGLIIYADLRGKIHVKEPYADIEKYVHEVYAGIKQ